MATMNWSPVLVCAGAVAGLLVAERAGSKKGVWFLKPLAASSYLWFALSLGALGTAYGRWLLLALLLCWWGDVQLIPKGSKSWFRAGILAFLAGHVTYVVAFLHQPGAWAGLGVGVLVAAALAWLVGSWLAPQLPRGFRRLVGLYVAVICCMLVAAFWAAAGSGLGRLALGACLFAVSDIAVARDRFISKAFMNRAWGLPLYFAAQLILASTAAAGSVAWGLT